MTIWRKIGYIMLGMAWVVLAAHGLNDQLATDELYRQSFLVKLIPSVADMVAIGTAMVFAALGLTFFEVGERKERKNDD